MKRGHRDLDAELQGHLQLHIDDGVRSGLSAADARRAALIKLGSIENVREAYRDQAGIPALRLIGDATRHGFRTVVRHRAFSLTVVAVLALGVGSTAALIGAVDALMFRPPAHVRAPETLVQVISAGNYPQYQALASRSRTLEATAFTRRTLTLGLGEAARAIETQCVTASYFPVLGAAVVAGRPFASTEDAPGAPATVVLGHRLWRREFAGDPAVAGSAVTIGDVPHTIVGIAPPDFRGVEMAPVDAWILLSVSPALCSLSGRDELASSSGSWLTVIGRLRDGVSVEQADSEIRTFALHEMRGPFRDPPARELRPIVEWRDSRVSRDRRLAVWLAAGAGLMLLICCANVAGLVSVRAVARRREMSLRFQLGATRARVFLQLLAEHVALAAVCVVAAWGVAGLVGDALRAFFPALLHDTWFDARTIGVVVLCALLASVLAGLVPSAQAARGGSAALWRHGPGVGQPETRTRSALLVAQIALALVLAVGAGLFARSVAEAKGGLGYDLDRVVVATLDLDRAGIRRQAEKRAVFDRLADRVRRLPAVDAVALTTASPLGSGQSYVAMPSGPPGAPGSGAGLARMVASVSPGYFETIGTRIVEGRSFTAADGPAGPAVAIVDAALAREMWPGERIVGQCREIASGSPCVEIVGLSEPRRMASLTRASGEIFYSLSQRGTSVPQALLVRTSGRAVDGVPVVTAAIRAAAAGLPYVSVRTLEDLADVQARSWRLGAMLFGLFGSLAIVLAAVGVYASLAFAVRQRTAEIGVRLTLGAAPGEIAGLVVRRGARLAAAGGAIGLVASAVLAQAMAGLLYGVAPTDAASFVAAFAVVAAAALAGCLLPAWRAARIDPAVALRIE
jgi:predicted permease